MNATKEACRYIGRQPNDESDCILASLLLALAPGRSFERVTLYKLDAKAFDLAIAALSEWRLDRHHVGKVKLFDLCC